MSAIDEALRRLAGAGTRAVGVASRVTGKRPTGGMMPRPRSAMEDTYRGGMVPERERIDQLGRESADMSAERTGGEEFPAPPMRRMDRRQLMEDEVAMPGNGYAAIDDFAAPLPRELMLKARPSVAMYEVGRTDEETNPNEVEPDRDADDYAPNAQDEEYSRYVSPALRSLFGDFDREASRQQVRDFTGQGARNPSTPMERYRFDEEMRRAERPAPRMAGRARGEGSAMAEMDASTHALEGAFQGGNRRQYFDNLDDFLVDRPAEPGAPSAKIEDRLRAEVPDDEEYQRLREQALMRLGR